MDNTPTSKKLANYDFYSKISVTISVFSSSDNLQDIHPLVTRNCPSFGGREGWGVKDDKSSILSQTLHRAECCMNVFREVSLFENIIDFQVTSPHE